MSRNFVAMMVPFGNNEFDLDPNIWYVVSPYQNPVTGEIDFDYYRLDKYTEAINAGLCLSKEKKAETKKQESPKFKSTITVGRL